MCTADLQHEISTGGVGESAKGSPGPIAQPDRITGRLLRAQSVSGKSVFLLRHRTKRDSLRTWFLRSFSTRSHKMAAHRLSADTKQLLASSQKRDQTALPCLCLSEAQNLCFGCGVPYHRARDIFVPWSSVTWKVRCQNAITQQEQCCKSLGTCRRSIISECAKLLCGSSVVLRAWGRSAAPRATESSTIQQTMYRSISTSP